MKSKFKGTNRNRIILNIEKKAIKLILLFFIGSLVIVFGAGYFIGKRSAEKEFAAVKKSIKDKVIYIPAKSDKNLNPAPVLPKQILSQKKEHGTTRVVDKNKNSGFDNIKITKTDTKKFPNKIVVPNNNSSQKANYKYYTIQVYSFKDPSTAQLRVNILKGKKLPAFLEKVNYNLTGTWYRVRIGKYKTKEEAYLEGRELEKWGIIPSFWIEGRND